MEQTRSAWTPWQKITFRFIFLYFALYILCTPWFSFAGLHTVGSWHMAVVDFLVYKFNDHLIHFKKELVPMNGSGDTSYAWVLLQLQLCLAVVGAALWSIFDRRKHSYYRLDYLLRTGLRYTIAYFAFTYGIIKVFLMQMIFPSLSQMASPLGELLPMRFSWLFIGSSDGYQFFSGMMEISVGILLLFRRTVTLGACFALAVFLNVMMLNLCYDIPVKIFSMHLSAMCAYLLTVEAPRLYDFFIRNRAVVGNPLYHFASARRSVKVARWLLKLTFWSFTAFMLYDTYDWYRERQSKLTVFAHGIFRTKTLVINNDTVPVLANDTLLWKDVIFEKDESGSVGSLDTVFKKRYGRGYFLYQDNPKKQVLHAFKYNNSDSIAMFDLQYKWKGKDTLYLRTKVGNDSILLELFRDAREFPMERREFHWLSETNR